jgi:hypothetical protein
MEWKLESAVRTVYSRRTCSAAYELLSIPSAGIYYLYSKHRHHSDHTENAGCWTSTPDYLPMPVSLVGTLQCTSIQWCGTETFWYGSGCGTGSSDPYDYLTDSDANPGGPKTYGSYGSRSGSGSGTPVKSHKEVTKQ